MRNIDSFSVAVLAAGIADAFRTCQLADHDGEARIDHLSRRFGGWVGVMMEIASAAEHLEQIRLSHGKSATWGGGLPPVYEVWDAVAFELWEHLGRIEIPAIVENALLEAASERDE